MKITRHSRCCKFLVVVSLPLSVATVTSMGNIAQAQIIPDETLGTESSTVAPLNGQTEQIDGGATRGSNLFHSFQEFNINEGREAYFANPAAIENIFSRVTGSNPSRLLGMLGVLGDANLFFLNPNGIIFGKNASLDIRGSLVTSTANSLLFPDGDRFSATNPQAAPLLEVDAPIPIGLQFEGEETGAIINAGDLEVGANLTLVGGNVTFDGGKITAPGGKVELGGLAAQGTVSINENGVLTFPDEVTRADVSFSNNASVNVAHQGGGFININARNLDLLGGSQLFGGIAAGLDATDNPAGDINLNATGVINVGQASSVQNSVNPGATGNSGNIEFQADSLFLNNSSIINILGTGAIGNAGNIDIKSASLGLNDSSTLISGSFSQGNAGDINIQANQISFNNGSIRNILWTEAAGNAGNINIRATDLSLSNSSVFNASTFGKGNAGNITIEATGAVKIVGGDILSTVETGGVGNGGTISINANSLSLTESGQIQTGVRGADGEIAGGQGNAGNIDIKTASFSLNDGSVLISGSFSQGNAGNVTIQADSLSLDNSSIRSISGTGAVGDAGNVNITATDLSLDDDSMIISGSDGQGNAGDINIQADSLSLDNGSIIEGNNFSGEGNAGDINIRGRLLSVTNGASITSMNFEQGNAGNITINASEKVSLDGFQDFFGLFSLESQISTNVEPEAVGNGGNIDITTGSLFITNDAELTASNLGLGNAGSVKINARDAVSLSGDSAIESAVGESNTGNGGNIDIQTRKLSLSDNVLLTTSTFGQGNSGNVRVNATESISVTDSSSIATLTRGQGNGGSITLQAGETVDFDRSSSAISSVQLDFEGIRSSGDITIQTDLLSVKNDSLLITSTLGSGDAGNIKINARDTVSFYGSGAFSNVGTTAVGKGGNVDITTGSLFLTNGAQLQAQVRGQGNGGNVKISAGDIVSFEGIGSDGISSGIVSQVSSRARGNGGNINITTDSLSVTKGAALQAQTNGQGNAGSVTISAGDKVFLERSEIFSTLEAEGVGIAGDISIDTGSLFVTNGAQMQSSTRGRGDAGDITINARDTVSFDGVNNTNPSAAFSTVEQGTGNGGKVEINTGSLAFTDGARIAVSTAGLGNAGDITINARDSVSFDGISSNGIGSGVLSTVETLGFGDGGQIDITTGSLNLTNGAQLTSTTKGQGNAGRVVINARDDISFDGVSSNSRLKSGVFTNVTQGATGNGGDIKISAPSISLANNAQMRTESSGEGDAGSISIQNADSVLLVDSTISTITSSNNSTGNAGDVTIDTTQLMLQDGATISSQSFFGQGGNVNLQGLETLKVFDSLITTSTILGQSGDLNVQATDRVQLNGRLSEDKKGGIAAQAVFGGTAGNVNIEAGDVFVEDGATVSAASFAFLGQAKNITISADSLFLDQGTIETVTSIADAENLANINLQLSDLLLMRNESQISAEATLGEANGGNIDIDAKFIIAFPPTGANGSDIIANASKGNGGNIQIATQGIFGIEFRDEQTPLNDFTVSSDFGLDGNFALDDSGIDPTRGLIILPEETVNTEISQGCQTVRGKEAVEYFEIGRGGLPPHPNEPLNADTVLEDWIDLNPKSENDFDSRKNINSPDTANTELISPCPAQ